MKQSSEVHVNVFVPLVGILQTFWEIVTLCFEMRPTAQCLKYLILCDILGGDELYVITLRPLSIKFRDWVCRK
jgi:hypothetical protein